MINRLRPLLAALALAALLGGCVAAPAGSGYPSSDDEAPRSSGTYIGVGGGLRL